MFFINQDFSYSRKFDSTPEIFTLDNLELKYNNSLSIDTRRNCHLIATEYSYFCRNPHAGVLHHSLHLRT